MTCTRTELIIIQDSQPSRIWFEHDFCTPNWRAKESNGAVNCNTLQRISIFMVLRYVYELVQIVNSHLITGNKNEIYNC